MSLDSPSLLGALQAGAAAVSRRPGARRMLEDCWTPVRNAAELRFADILLETLGPLARSEDEDEARPAKHVLLRDKATLQAFSEALQSEFRQAVDDFCAQRVGGKPTGAPGLTLVEYDAMEFATLMERASARIRNAVDDEFGALKVRLANLVREPEVRDIENPFRPVIFLRAMYLALERVGITEPDLLRMTKRFDSALVEPIAAAYAAVDRHLAAQGISADVTPAALVRNSMPQVPATPFTNSVLGGYQNSALGAYQNSVLGAYQNTRNTLGPVSQAAAALTTGGPHLASGLALDQVLQALYQRMSLATVPLVPGASVVASPANISAGLPQAPLLVADGNPAAPVAWTAAPVSMGVPAAVTDAALMSAIAEAQRLDAGGVAAVPHAAADSAGLRTQVAQKASKQVDKLTIEIVGLLFERIDQDKHVPPQIKEQLVRLQFPMIRVALTDTELFVSPRQPARQLLDRIATTSIGWVPQGDHNERYLAEVREAVSTVVEAADESLAPFQLALDRFELYLTQENTRDDDPVARAKRAIEEAETREVQAINATIQIRQAFEGVMLESYLRDFLLETWVRVLVAANLREPTQPGLMRHYLKLVPALVWTVQPKVNPEEKAHLARKVAPVLTALREGLALIEWPQAKSQEFFARLMNSHAQAVKALELAQGATAAFNPSTMRIKLDGVTMSADTPAGDNAVGELPVSDDEVTRVLAANQVAVKHVSAPPEAPASADGEIDKRIESLRRGDWFDLTTGERVERVQLRWLSPRRAIYLFATAQDERIFSMKPATLRSLMREGHVAPVEAEHIFERALRETMDVLQHAAGEASAVA